MRLRVVTYNVGLMRLRAMGVTLFERPADVARRAVAVPRYIRGVTADADVLCIQECYEEEHREAMRTALSDAFPYSCHSDPVRGPWLNGGLMTFSRYPIESSVHMAHGRRCWYEALFGDRSMLVARLRAPSGTLSVINAHLSAGIEVDSPGTMEIRDSQIEDLRLRVREELRRCDGVIIAGDFNCSPDVAPRNYAMLSCTRKWRDAWLEGGGGRQGGVTWDADRNPLNAGRMFPGRSHRCDHVWVAGERIVVGSCRLVDAPPRVSDHYGVECTLRIASARDCI
jgi:endonuclease/exonuclease/phosphatase family metal-dependent hydrolase